MRSPDAILPPLLLATPGQSVGSASSAHPHLWLRGYEAGSHGSLAPGAKLTPLAKFPRLTSRSSVFLKRTTRTRESIRTPVRSSGSLPEKKPRGSSASFVVLLATDRRSTRESCTRRREASVPSSAPANLLEVQNTLRHPLGSLRNFATYLRASAEGRSCGSNVAGYRSLKAYPFRHVGPQGCHHEVWIHLLHVNARLVDRISRDD